MFQHSKKYGKIADRDLGMFTLGLVVGSLSVLVIAWCIIDYILQQ